MAIDLNLIPAEVICNISHARADYRDAAQQWCRDHGYDVVDVGRARIARDMAALDVATGRAPAVEDPDEELTRAIALSIVNTPRRAVRADALGDADVDLVSLSCGGGRQSSALVLMACHGLIPRPDVVIMADTGWERKETLLYWDQVLVPACEAAGIPTYLVSAARHETGPRSQKPGSLRRSGLGMRDDLLRSVREGTPIANPPYRTDKGNGKSAPLKRACTKEYKIEPINVKVRALLGLRPGQVAKGKVRVETWIGIATEESKRAKGFSGFDWNTLRYPLLELDMSTDDCIRMITDLGYPVPVKSACIGCAYRSDASWARMKANDPAAWADAVDFDEKLRHPFGMGRLNDGMAEADYLAGRKTLKGAQFPAYVHPSCKPLAEVELPDLLDLVEDASESFGGEC